MDTMAQLFVDIGNTRMKWAVLPCGQCEAEYACADNIADLLAAWEQLPYKLSEISVAAVGSEALVSAIAQWAQQHQVAFSRLHTTKHQAGVTCAYAEPHAWGVDRWLALVAAKAEWPEQTLAVVDCGTAITLDVLANSGQHLGGLIAPGVGLMQQSLSQRTAQIDVASAWHVPLLAVETPAAVSAGSVHAAAGFLHYIRQVMMAELLSVSAVHVDTWIITGGDAVGLMEHLSGMGYSAHQILSSGNEGTGNAGVSSAAGTVETEQVFNWHLRPNLVIDGMMAAVAA